MMLKVLSKTKKAEINKFLLELGFEKYIACDGFDDYIYAGSITNLTISLDNSEIYCKIMHLDNTLGQEVLIFNGFIYNLHHLKMILIGLFGKEQCKKVLKFTIKSDIFNGKFDLDKLLGE